MKVAKVLLGLPVVLCIILSACTKEYHPQEGTWYCEELQLQLSFGIYILNEPGNSKYNDELYGYIIIDGERIGCQGSYDGHSRFMGVHSQELDNKKYPAGYQFYLLEAVSLGDTQYVVKDEAGNQYTFIRQD